MAVAGVQAGIGSLLREWRARRAVTQLALALDTGISTRHLSFVETGRSKPGRDVLLRVGERLEIPFRERNQLLLVAGYAPANQWGLTPGSFVEQSVYVAAGYGPAFTAALVTHEMGHGFGLGHKAFTAMEIAL